MKDKLKTACDYLRSKGVAYGDIRYVRTQTETIGVTNEAVDTLTSDLDQGFGIRVIVEGSWGFASSAICTVSEMRKVANRAIAIAKASGLTKTADVVLAPVDPAVGTYQTPVVIDPFKVSISRKLSLLTGINRVLRKDKKIRVAECGLRCFGTHKIFVSTEGAVVEQHLTEVGAGYTATAVDGNEVQKRSYPNSHGGDYRTGGYELIEGMRLKDHAERVREEAVALLTAPACP
ncbi:MAG TPA: DNA gyrase modulator, partial [Acidobacteriota bacterium]|nr:DNA gyrase modulator [Acidobacteriota bacterium]